VSPGPPGEARALAVAAAIVLAAAGLSFALLGAPFYHFNDDVVMSTIVSGVGWIGGELHPSPRAVFVHLLLGRALVALYAARPDVPWYGLMLVTAVLLSATAFGFAGLRLRPARTAAALVGLFSALVALAGLSFLHFGIAASLQAGAALALGVSLTLRPPESPGWTGALALAGLLAALFGALLRPESFWLGAAAMAPLVSLAVQARGLRSSRALLAGLVAVALAHAALFAYERRDYAAAPGWGEAFEWMDAKRVLLDYSAIVPGPGSRAAFQEAGWSANDFDQLRGWFVWDPERYSAASLRRLYGILRRHAAVAPASLGEGRLTRALLTPVSLAALAVTLLVGWTVPRREGVNLLLGLLWGLGLLVGVAIVLRAPPARVHLPVWLLTLAVPVSWGALRESADAAVRSARAALWMAVAAVAAALLVHTWTARAEAGQREQRAAAARRDLARLAPYREGLLLNWAGLFPVHELVRPLEPFSDRSGQPRELGRYSFFWLGWPARLPVNQLWLERHGVHDLYRALYERDDLLLLTRPEYLPFVERDIREHRGVEVGHERVVEGETVSAFRLVRSRPATSAP
jgi:hypothetical protein